MAPKKTTKKPAAKSASKVKAKAKPVVKKPVKATAKVAPKAKPVAKPAPKKIAPKAAPKPLPKPSTTPTKSLATPAKIPTSSKPAKVTTNNQQRTTTFRVLRGTVVGGQLVQKTQEFQVPYDTSTTVLLALEWIKGELDGTLTFRRSCRASICGSCGMVINGKSRLACKTKLMDLVDGNASKNIAPAVGGVIEIAPQRNQPVLKDLVVDIAPFYDKVKAILPFVKEGPEAATSVDKDSFSQVNMVSNCIMCGACYSDCTAMVENPDFLGPAALAKAYRFVADPREGHKTERLQQLVEKNGVWDCTRCSMCIDACPKGVAPMEAILKLRTLAMQARITGNAGARHAMAFKTDIATWGILNEPFMLLKTLRLGILGQLGNAWNLAKKGKIPNPLPFHERPNGLHEIKAIYAELAKNPIDVQTKAADSGPGAG
ncbi:MAG: 2Fe-2S iron-sulfur cluster-binding protein [Alphaproteobacteria bacterium]